jgi:hypothetical protein
MGQDRNLLKLLTKQEQKVARKCGHDHVTNHVHIGRTTAKAIPSPLERNMFLGICQMQLVNLYENKMLKQPVGKN